MPSPTSIRFPPGMPAQPLMDGLTHTNEDTRSNFEPETGPPRKRQTMRTAPLRMAVTFLMSPKQFQEFDHWWHFVLRGGLYEFDVELVDTYGSISWYTCEAIGEYSARIDGTRDAWNVDLQLRSRYAPFYFRPSGTDELMGITAPGIGNATGVIQIGKALRGTTSVGIGSASGRLAQIGMQGKAFGVGIQTARGRLDNDIYLYGVADISVTPVGELDVG